MSDIKRATDQHTVMAVIGKPKPEPKRKKARHSINARKVIEQQLEDICKLLVFWRDGAECVERNMDGGRCGGGVQWGHYVPRQQSRWLKYEIGNTFAQCRNHNLLHDKGAQTMGVWFVSTFGTRAACMIEAERAAHRGEKNQTIDELREMLDRYTELYQNRFYVTPILSDLIAAGYYGETIRKAAEMEQR